MSEGEGRWTEYAGGYSDMVAQRGAGVTRRVAEKADAAPKQAAAEPTAPAPERAGKRKLSFKEKHALETLPGKIDQLAAKAGDLHERLADPTLFAKDSKKFAALSQELAKVEAEKATAEEEWLTLEMLREEIEG